MTVTIADKKIHHFEFTVALESFMNQIAQFQIAKLSPHEIAVRIIPGQTFKPETSASVREKIATLVGPSVSVRVECVQHIQRAPQGKTRVIVDESKK